MTLQINPNEKFAALALVRASRSDLSAPLDLGGGLWASVTAPVDVGATWREWVGSIHANRIADANLWFIAKRPSTSPEILDQENKDLRDEVWHLFLALLILGSPYYEGGYVLTGSHVGGTPAVREYGQIQQYFVSFQSVHLTIEDGDIRMANRIMSPLRTVYGSANHKRVKRGISVFLKGLEEAFAIARLHQFVRSVEAVVKPGPTQIKRKYIDRCRTFTCGDPQADIITGQCYELRSKEEHLLDWEDALASVSAAQREELLFQRVRQCEGLARHIYQRILTSAQHQTDFADAAIDPFWGLPDPQRLVRWGAPVDLARIR